MHVTIVSIKVKSGNREAFRRATLENVAGSRAEAGVFRFELLEDGEDPCHFILIEGYRDDGAPALHRESAHYRRWRDAVEPMMAEPRAKATYRPVGEF